VTGVRDVAQGLKDYEAWATDTRPRIGWGLPFFDSRTNGGLARQESCLLIASSNAGKTSIALNVIRVNPDVPVVVFSIEMAWRMLTARLVAQETGQSTTQLEQDLKNGVPNPGFQQVMDKFPLLLCDDTAGVTLKQADETFQDATQRLQESPRLVVWDFAERIGGSGLMTKAESMDRLFIKLQDWTANHDTASLILHQRGMNDPGWMPVGLNDGRYGGHQYVDYVVGAYAPRLDPSLSAVEREAVKEEVFLQLLKSRAGTEHPSGVRHRLDSRTMRLSEWHQQVWSQSYVNKFPNMEVNNV